MIVPSFLLLLLLLSTEILWFIRLQVRLANELHKPLYLHSRLAHDDFITVMKDYSGPAALVHCFTGSIDELQCIWFPIETLVD